MVRSTRLAQEVPGEREQQTDGNIQASLAMQGRPQREMAQKARLHETFFSLKNPEPRPNSVMTEFMDTEWDQASVEIVSENEEENSPRHSLNSVGGPRLSDR